MINYLKMIHQSLFATKYFSLYFIICHYSYYSFTVFFHSKTFLHIFFVVYVYFLFSLCCFASKDLENYGIIKHYFFLLFFFSFLFHLIFNIFHVFFDRTQMNFLTLFMIQNLHSKNILQWNYLCMYCCEYQMIFHVCYIYSFVFIDFDSYQCCYQANF